MTDSAAIGAVAPLQVTVYPLQQSSTGRVVNTNATAPNVPDNPDFWGQGGVSFKTVLDTINPLQHIPVVATLYQSLTGDVPSPGANIAGGALFGGAVGMAASVMNEIIKTQTGDTIGGHMLALLQSGSAMQTAMNTTSGGSDSGAPYLSPSQRASYNAYVRANALS